MLSVLLVALTLLLETEARTCVCGATWGGGSVNVRSCASTSCNIVGSIGPGECHDSQATEADWERITYNSATAYVHGDYVSGPQECGGALYCTAVLCSTYVTNEKRGCDPDGCGNYGSSRGSRAHGGWDVKCDPAGAAVRAPFDGVITRRAYPYGDGSCCDTGFEIQGSGIFSGHEAKLFYCDPDRVSVPSTVNKGQEVATHRSLHCGCYSSSTMTDHVHYQVLYEGVAIDPASFLFC